MGEHETIPTRRLRPALEFALEVAADVEGEFSLPEAVRRHLRRPMSPQALGPVRRAIDANDEFRAVVAARLVAATGVGADGAEPADTVSDTVSDSDLDDEPVDPIGSLWLLRPPGWLEAVDLLLELERQQAEIDAADAARRREEKRRQAAEAHVERERAERERVQRRFDAQAGQLAAATERVDALERDLEKARHELTEARMSVRHAGDRERAALERLDRLEAERRVAATEATGTATGGDDVATPVVDTAESEARWRTVIAEELMARVRHVGDDFVDALVGEIAERLLADTDARSTDGPGDRTGETPTADGRSSDGRTADRIAVAARSGDRTSEATPSPPARRRALRMPPGVVSESTVGVEFLLRSGARVIVDGYNVSKTAWPHLELIEQRERLVALLESLTERHGIDIQVVFDGADVVGARTARRRIVDVVFSPAGVLADEVIGRQVRRLPPERPVVVVTDDRAVRDDVRSAGANIVASAALLEYGRR